MQKPEEQNLSDEECDASPSEVIVDETLAAKTATTTDNTTEFGDPPSLSTSLPISPTTSSASKELDSSIPIDTVDEALASATSDGSQSFSPVDDEPIGSYTAMKSFNRSIVDTPPLLSPNDSALNQSTSSCLVRRRWLMRDIRTGRIIVPYQRLCFHIAEVQYQLHIHQQRTHWVIEQPR